MTEHAKSADFALPRFGIGSRAPRMEDPKLLRGDGTYTDDIAIAGQVYAKMVRSIVANGVIRSIDTSAALQIPGVLAVYTGADLAAYAPLRAKVPLKSRDGSPIAHSAHPYIPADRVSFVGEPVACVVAETEAAAMDGAEAVLADIDATAAVVTMAAALSPGAPQIHPDAPGNVAVDYHYGDSAAVAAAFARASHVTRLRLVNQRLVINCLEPRAAVALFDADTGRFTLHVSSQGAFGLKRDLAEALGVAADKVRVLTPSVGGSFGLKIGVFPEHLAILHAARALGRPVKWTNTRSESFLSDHHGRDADVTAELALDTEGTFLAVRITGSGNLGAVNTIYGLIPPTLNVVRNVVGPYRTPVIEVATKAVFTNTVPIGPYRGAGRPEGNYYMQRLVDQAASEMGIDPVELRRRNLIPNAALPFKAASGEVYDSGDFEGLLDHALAIADWNGFAERRRASEAKGRLRGRGIGQYLEMTAGPGPEMGGIRFDADGHVTIITGTLDYGQGHAAPFAQVLVDRLGIPFERIRLLQGDSNELIAGGGTGGSRSIMASGSALVAASTEVISRGKQIASALLEASAGDIEHTAGRFRVVGTDKAIGLLEMAEQLAAGVKLPEGCPATLDVRLVDTVGGATFPNGCHICEVEIDPATGETRVDRYTAVDDFGTIVNPMIVEGQMHGGIAQGIGQALYEDTVYDENGQLLAGSFMDYTMPRADDVPNFTIASHPAPATTNPLGVKGCGEAGCAGSITAVMNAVVDALRPLGIHHIDMPATPTRVWAAIQKAR
jgi:carbon-monoxide dehydrogenase large subunit